jgi:hypothetical protein
VLRLDALEFTDLSRWHWILTDASGRVLARHEVLLDTTRWQFDAFADLARYLSWYTAPDERVSDEARIVAELGEWIGAQVLGQVGEAMMQASPVAVQLTVPENAAALLHRPLELAHVRGRPLAAQGVTLVLGTGSAGRAARPVGDRLRVLGVFSLPEGGRPLSLRRERRSLVDLFEALGVAGKAADVQVLQYGVTRDRLRDVLSDPEGWDIIHLSGHGFPGQLLLETDEGSPDLVDGAGLEALLDLARGRLKLVTISACWSAAVVIARHRQLLGLPEREGHSAARAHAFQVPGQALGSLAAGLADRMGCAVLAMRYPVSDQFAAMLSSRLYSLLADKGLPLPEAVGASLRELARETNGSPLSPLSVVTPALFGSSAVDLRLPAPARRAKAGGLAESKMTGFPAQPERFVGRTAVMARAGAALALGSGVPGVLLYGMPGGGKSACALELAYGHEHVFELLTWHKAPDEGADITGALTDFALSLERGLPGFQMAHALVSPPGVRELLPRLTQLMERRLLIVVDNVESLLADDGGWRDARWGDVLGALTAHSGPGRVMLTSRRVLPGLERLHAAAVTALSAGEAVLLTEELPNISALKHGRVPGIDRGAARRLARRVLEITRGHPKLLELAEAQAGDPESLARLIAVGARTWRQRGGLPGGFFSGGDETASSEDYLCVLAAWTRSVAQTLAESGRELFWLLCCLEEPDRTRHVLDGTWAGLQTRLRPDGHPPELDTAVASVAACGLAAADLAGVLHAVHPSVAETGRGQAGQRFRDAVDTEVARYWRAVYRDASGGAGDGPVNTELLVRAGLAAVPYLLRQQRWDDAATRMHNAFVRDPSRANAAAMAPAIMRVARSDPRHGDVLATVLQVIDPAAGESAARAALDAVIADRDYRKASAICGKLAENCIDSGRLAEARRLLEQKAAYTRQAGLGPWTHLADQTRLLQVMAVMGRTRRVLDDVARLRGQMDALPGAAGPGEAITPWNVREALLGTGRSAATRLGRYAEALDLNAAVITSKRDRAAPPADIARARFNDYFPLLMLNKPAQAADLLQDCLRVFRETRDSRMIAKTFSALADIEGVAGDGDSAIRLARNALRYAYLAGDVLSIAKAYHSLGSHLHRRAAQPGPALACHLAAALIRALAGVSGDPADGSGDALRSAANDLHEHPEVMAVPAGIESLAGQVGEIPGTDLRQLIATLAAGPEAAERALRDLVAEARLLADAADRDGG